MGAMTQARSRMLGRALIGIAALAEVALLRQTRRRPLPAWLLLAMLTVPVSAYLAWTGYTLATMNWDDPEDYPPAS
jgi:hypothetical protein